MNEAILGAHSRTGRSFSIRSLWNFLAGLVAEAEAQTVMIVGTQHLRGLETRPTPEQYEHTVDTLSQYRPTQVCVERMDGERNQSLRI